MIELKTNHYAKLKLIQIKFVSVLKTKPKMSKSNYYLFICVCIFNIALSVIAYNNLTHNPLQFYLPWSF